MENIQTIVKNALNKTLDPALIETSIQKTSTGLYFLVRKTPAVNWLVACETKAEKLAGLNAVQTWTEANYTVALAPLSNENSLWLSGEFNWMKPIKRTGHNFSFGLGDRLGLASNAHLKLFKGKGVLPVLAQQSIRELNLTGRTYSDVIASAMWAVFEQGFTEGYSADGDHLKNPFEIDYAVKCGFPMITLDCSEHIRNEVADFDAATLKTSYELIDANLRSTLEARYLDQTFNVAEGVSVSFTEKNFMESVLIFNDAINFADEMYQRFVVVHDLDFEISIDETIVPTTPENHYFIANELQLRGIVVETMAPKFCGEFQKAIDYVGDLDQFEREYKIHEAIAAKFHYRLSIHSGSDKFKVYPAIGSISERGWHVKTAGTNWLEALRVVAKNDPAFMLDLYQFAGDNLNKAKAYYHIDATTENITQLETLSQTNIASVLDEDMARQALHVTFGLILTHEVEGKKVLKERIYELLQNHSEDYDYFLNKHIGKHLALLNK